MPNHNRKARLESLLHQEIAMIVNRDLRDPRMGFVTVTRVEMTDDLHNVKAFYTVFGDAKQRKMAKQALDSAAPFVQRTYAPVIHTRMLPLLSFAYDEGTVTRTAMEDLIRKARESDPDQGKQPTPEAHPQPQPQPTLFQKPI